VFGWFTKWRESVDIGLRPRHALEGAEINLYPLTKRAAEWLAQIWTASRAQRGRSEKDVWSYRTLKFYGSTASSK
jgi:hypothetical protein